MGRAFVGKTSQEMLYNSQILHQEKEECSSRATRPRTGETANYSAMELELEKSLAVLVC